MSLDSSILRPAAPTIPIPVVRRAHRYRPQTRAQRVVSLARGLFRRARHAAPVRHRLSGRVRAALGGALLSVVTVVAMGLAMVLA